MNKEEIEEVIEKINNCDQDKLVEAIFNCFDSYVVNDFVEFLQDEGIIEE